MSKEITQKKVTLESIATTLETVVLSTESNTKSIESVATTLETVVASVESHTKSIESVATTLETVVLTTESNTRSIDALNTRIDDLPTRKEMNNAFYDTENHLKDCIENEINDLALTTNNEFERVHKKFDIIDKKFDLMNEEFNEVHIKLGDMSKNTIEFRQDFDLKATGFQNQLDIIYNRYPNREEYDFLNKRVKRIEKEVFA